MKKEKNLTLGIIIFILYSSVIYFVLFTFLLWIAIDFISNTYWFFTIWRFLSLVGIIFLFPFQYIVFMFYFYVKISLNELKIKIKDKPIYYRVLIVLPIVIDIFLYYKFDISSKFNISLFKLYIANISALGFSYLYILIMYKIINKESPELFE